MNKKLKGKIITKFGTQCEFARAIHEHESVVSKILRGRRELGEKDKKLWATVLGEEPADLFEREGLQVDE
jgi:transcriptional regulator with XRE-family HTH domain